MARKISLDKVKEDDLVSLLESISEKLTMEDLEDLEKQRRQFEEEVEAGQQPSVPQTKYMTIEILKEFNGLLHKTLDFMENMDLDFERSGLKRRQTMDIMAYYEDLLSEKRRKAMQTTLDRFFMKKKSFLLDASTSDEPQPGTSSGGYAHPNVPLSSPLLSPSPLPVPLPSSSSDVNNLGII